MKTYFRLNSNGTVNVEHKLFNGMVKKEQFAELSVNVEFNNFIEFIKDKELRKAIVKERERLLELTRLSMVGTKVVDGTIQYFCVGQLSLRDYFNSIKIQEFAIKYGYKYYGEELMNSLIEAGIFSGKSIELRYFVNNTQISSEEYEQLYMEKKILMVIRDLSSPLDKSQSCIKKEKVR